jgi:hypothetical protein
MINSHKMANILLKDKNRVPSGFFILVVYMMFFLTLIFPVLSSGENTWIKLTEDEKGRFQTYYNRESIRKITGNIFEVYDITTKPAGSTIRKLRIKCKTGKYAIGQVELYSTGAETPYQTFDFSDNGWMWFKPGGEAEKKLVTIVCEKNR